MRTNCKRAHDDYLLTLVFFFFLEFVACFTDACASARLSLKAANFCEMAYWAIAFATRANRVELETFSAPIMETLTSERLS